ncbi:CobD/CbiB family protein [Rivibacter subsaxonicus]|uniref:Cobalamin biosynthesis protein CobD n=1 Tax=Rivibacter subsaxonicus TaxID=457575 RepID=A0A4Q7VH02_9BURK|nr:CobD/CbiB family protein [Rivibacter subsaxonicus]RZT95329.1 adenosylcobinamide-phosphate synthase [Rivibacter subsaxonicus]
MSFFSVLLALLIEQVRPLPRKNGVHETLVAWTRWSGRNFDAGREHHAWVVWGVSVIGPTLVAWGVYLAFAHFSFFLALAWNVAVLYLTLGFRHFSHYYTDIRDALERGDEIAARQLLAEWRHVDASDLPRDELLRQVIEHSLLAAHRHVFGVFFWFVVLAAFGFGPAGAVLYRLAEFSQRYWAYKNRTTGVAMNEGLRQRAESMFELIDHVPSRLTAFGFAVVGNFEEAVACWRRDAELWRQPNDGIVLAAAAGAVGVRLGGKAPPPLGPDRSQGIGASAAAQEGDATGSTPGVTPELGHLRSVVGLVWRSVVLWMLLLVLLSLANLVG